MKRIFGAVVLASALVLSGCGGGSDEGRQVASESYEPSYYGNDDTEQCYYVEDPDEVRVLKEDGLCEQDWYPAPWPDDDLAGFYPYFFFIGGDSDRHHYRSRYVPKYKHSSYSTKFKALSANPTFQSKVKALSPKAPYKSSTGKIVTGSKVKPNSFGGALRTGGNSGLRPKGCAMSVTDLGAIDLVSYSVAAPVAKGGGKGGSKSSKSSKSNKTAKPKDNGGIRNTAPTGKPVTPKSQAPAARC